MNIYEKLLAIQSELKKVAKNLEVGVCQSKYKAVGEADVLSAIKPLEEKYKVYSYPFKREIIESGLMENESVDYKTKEKVTKKNLFLRLETTYRFVNFVNPEEYIDITTYGDGIDSQDKAVGKAMTYVDKYALMKCYKIVTGDDPDQNPSEDLKGLEKKPVDENDYRKELIMFCKENGLDIVKISKEFKLTSTSSQEEFKKTLESIRGK